MSRFGKVLRVCSDLNHMLHRLCGSPSIPLSFNLAVVLPGGVLNALAAALRGGNPLTLSTHRLRRGLRVSNPVLIPTLSHISVSYRPESRLRHWCSSISLRISPLHMEFHFLFCTQVFQFPMTLHG